MDNDEYGTVYMEAQGPRQRKMGQISEKLKTLNEFITIKERQEMTFHQLNIYNYFVNEMKEKDDVFRKIYNGYDIAGSYADGLKVSLPNEYDINLRCKLPLRTEPIRVKSAPEAGWATLNITDKLTQLKLDRNHRDVYDRFMRLVDANGYLIQKDFLDWIDTIFQKVKNGLNKIDSGTYKININGQHYQIKQSRNGPAITISILSPKKFSIDLVPVIEFSGHHWISSRAYKESYEDDWNCVPKPYYDNTGKIYWRCSYVKLERKIINNKVNLKNLIRIFKKIRDANNIANFKSYYIKTIFLWTLEENGNAYFSQSLATNFIEMFDIILIYLRTGIPFYWNRDCDMLSHFTKSQKETMFNQFMALRNKMQKNIIENENYSYLDELILTNEERRKGQMGWIDAESLNLNALSMSTLGSNRESIKQKEEVVQDNLKDTLTGAVAVAGIGLTFLAGRSLYNWWNKPKPAK